MIDDITDHLPVLCLLPKLHSECTNVSDVRFKRKLTERNLQLFKSLLDTANWDELYKIENVNTAYDLFYKQFIRMFDASCPKVTVNERKRKDKPWLTNGLINACHKKNVLYICQLSDKSEVARQRYLKYKNKLTSVIRKAEKQYYIDKLNCYKGKIKETWSVLNHLLGRGKKTSTLCDFVVKNNAKITNTNEIANEFNDFYINVGPNLAKNIDSANLDIQFNDYIKNIDTDNSMFVLPTTESEIIGVVSKFTGKSSEDVSGVSMKVVKSVIGCISKPITYICNLSVNTGTLPDELKVAKVLPLYKSGTIHEVSNYRPVSILPQMSKILEKLFETRLRKYIDKNNFLFKGQYGFRTNHSTNLALNEMVNMIVNALDKKKCLV